MKVGNNVGCHIKGIGSIILDGKTKISKVYIFDGLEHNFLSFG